MNDFDRLRELLRGQPYLIVDGISGDVRLADRALAFRKMTETGLFHSQVVMDAAAALRNFAKLTGSTDREFGSRDVAKIAGVAYSQLYGWLMEEVLVPSVQPRQGAGRGKNLTFSWPDAYVAGLLGSLRRQGVRLELLAQACRLFGKPTKTKKPKRPARKVIASARA